jgi:hypothetical protein
MRSPGSRACSFTTCIGVFDYAGSRDGLALRPRSFRLPFLTTRSAARTGFTKLNPQPADPSVYASTAASRRHPQNSRPRWGYKNKPAIPPARSPLLRRDHPHQSSHRQPRRLQQPLRRLAPPLKIPENPALEFPLNYVECVPNPTRRPAHLASSSARRWS